MSDVSSSLINDASTVVESLREAFDFITTDHPEYIRKNPELLMEYAAIRTALSNFELFSLDIQVSESIRAANFMRKFRFFMETLRDKPAVVH